MSSAGAAGLQRAKRKHASQQLEWAAQLQLATPVSFGRRHADFSVVDCTGNVRYNLPPKSLANTSRSITEQRNSADHAKEWRKRHELDYHFHAPPKGLKDARARSAADLPPPAAARPDGRFAKGLTDISMLDGVSAYSCTFLSVDSASLDTPGRLQRRLAQYKRERQRQLAELAEQPPARSALSACAPARSALSGAGASAVSAATTTAETAVKDTWASSQLSAMPPSQLTAVPPSAYSVA